MFQQCFNKVKSNNYISSHGPKKAVHTPKDKKLYAIFIKVNKNELNCHFHNEHRNQILFNTILEYNNEYIHNHNNIDFHKFLIDDNFQHNETSSVQ